MAGETDIRNEQIQLLERWVAEKATAMTPGATHADLESTAKFIRSQIKRGHLPVERAAFTAFCEEQLKLTLGLARVAGELPRSIRLSSDDHSYSADGVQDAVAGILQRARSRDPKFARLRQQLVAQGEGGEPDMQLRQLVLISAHNAFLNWIRSDRHRIRGDVQQLLESSATSRENDDPVQVTLSADRRKALVSALNEQVAAGYVKRPDLEIFVRSVVDDRVTSESLAGEFKTSAANVRQISSRVSRRLRPLVAEPLHGYFTQ